VDGILPFVMTSCASLPCSATSGKIAAHQKKPIAGFPGSSDKNRKVFCQELSQLAERSAYGQLVLQSTLPVGCFLTLPDSMYQGKRPQVHPWLSLW
jgi:hypothetical protein